MDEYIAEDEGYLIFVFNEKTFVAVATSEKIEIRYKLYPANYTRNVVELHLNFVNGAWRHYHRNHAKPFANSVLDYFLENRKDMIEMTFTEFLEARKPYRNL